MPTPTPMKPDDAKAANREQQEAELTALGCQMSEEDFDALESELRRFATAFKNLADGLGHNVSPTFSLNVVERAISEPPLNEIDFSKLVAFLREYTEVRERHTAGEEEIRKLGI